MSAPAGLCVSCGLPMQWCFIHGEQMVRCSHCLDFFAVEGVTLGTEVAGSDNHEGREAVMPDGRPVRPIERIVQDAYSLADCEVW